MFDLTTVHDRRRNSGFLKQQALYCIALHCIVLYLYLIVPLWYASAAYRTQIGVSQSEALFTVMIFYDIKSLT